MTYGMSNFKNTGQSSGGPFARVNLSLQVSQGVGAIGIHIRLETNCLKELRRKTFYQNYQEPRLKDANISHKPMTGQFLSSASSLHVEFSELIPE